MDIFRSIDVGLATTKFAVIDKDSQLISSIYLHTQGKPIAMI